MTDTGKKSRYEEWTYHDLMEATHEADGVFLMRVTGVAVHHDVFMLSEGGWPSKLVYIISPESGPLGFMRDWPHLVNNVNVWDLGAKEDALAAEALTREVLHWVVDQCQDQVLQEIAP